MSDDTRAREQRRCARATAPGEIFRDGSHPDVDVSQLTPDERVSLVLDLTLTAWSMSGRELPALPRSAWPGKVVRVA